MWALSQTIPSLPHHTISPKLLPLPLTISANSHPRRHQSKPPRNDAVPTKDIKGLGHTILEVTAVNSTTPNPIPKQQKQEDEGRQISGSDVLRALQRAAAQKKEFSKSKKMKSKKMKKNTRGVSSSVEEDSLDYSKVRPLCIKSEWGVRLVELEKRLQELSGTHS